MSPKTSTFIWQGTNTQGHTVKGEMTTSNIHMARAELYRQGISAQTIRRQPRPLWVQRKQKIKGKDIAFFTRQLATLIGAGIPLVQSLEVIARGQASANMQTLVHSIKSEVESGKALSGAFDKHPAYFDSLYCNLVQAGEQAGALENLLNRIATHKEKTEALKGKVQKAMYYPVTVLLVAGVITAIIMVFVIPQFEAMFKSFGADLPVPTQAVIRISEFMQTYWWTILVAIFMGSLLLKRLWQKSHHFRKKADRVILKLPLIGHIMHKSALARFCRTTAIMFAAGVPLVDALHSVSRATNSPTYRQAIQQMRDEIASGQALHLSMRQHIIFPNLLRQMVAIGEESGSLDAMLSRVADFYEEEVDNLVNSLSNLMEPIVIMLLGAIIGGLVITLYLPMFQIGSVLSGS